MKKKIPLLLILLAVALFGVAFASRFAAYECKVTLAIVRVPAGGGAEFRVKSAVEHMIKKSSLDDLADRLAFEFPTDRERAEMRKCLNDIRIDVVKEPLLSIVVTTPIGPRKIVRGTGQFVADAVRRHFDAEADGLREKMTAWFEQEIRKRQKNGEEVAGLKTKAAQALKDAGDQRIAFSDRLRLEMSAKGDAMIYRWMVEKLRNFTQGGGR